MRAAENAKLYEALSGGASVQKNIGVDAKCLLSPGYRLIRVDHRVQPSELAFEIALVNDLESSVAYHCQVVMGEIAGLGIHTVTYRTGWRSPEVKHVAVLQNIGEKLAFNYLLPLYDIVSLGSSHSGLGALFWQRLMSQAVAYRFYVYAYRSSSDQLISIQQPSDFQDFIDDLWRQPDDMQCIGLVSKQSLPFKNSQPLERAYEVSR